MGTHHARAYALNPASEVVAVADNDEENRQLFSKRFGVTPYSSYADMLSNEGLDIVGAVLPVKAHADAVVAAAEAGAKAVFCEKPMTARLSDADRMVTACEANGTKFAAGVIPRNYPEYWKARDMVDAGEIGQVQTINVYDPNGQGGCHGINLALMFAHDYDVDWGIGWVGGDPHNDEDGDGALDGLGGYFRFQKGIEVFVSHRPSVMYRAGESGQGFEVIGTHGVLWNDFQGLHIAKAPDGYEPGQRADLKEIEGVFEDTRNIVQRGYDDEGWRLPTPGMQASVQALVTALENNETPRMSTGQSLRKALEICIGLRESARHNQAVVKFPIEDRSLIMYPVPSRWNFKKDIYGRDDYMEQLAVWTKS
jgi:predicted dehydrogenase